MIGKSVAQRLYVHVASLSETHGGREETLTRAEALACVRRGKDFNVVRFDPSESQIALLHYPGIVEDPFPMLRESWRVDIATGQVAHRTYVDSLNPPILHRKELLLPDDHPRRVCRADRGSRDYRAVRSPDAHRPPAPVGATGARKGLPHRRAPARAVRER